MLKGYLKGLGIMALERIEGVPNPLIIKWIRNYSKILKELIAKTTVAETIKNSTILEMDELLLRRNKSRVSITKIHFFHRRVTITT